MGYDSPTNAPEGNVTLSVIVGLTTNYGLAGLVYLGWPFKHFAYNPFSFTFGAYSNAGYCTTKVSLLLLRGSG